MSRSLLGLLLGVENLRSEARVFPHPQHVTSSAMSRIRHAELLPLEDYLHRLWAVSSVKVLSKTVTHHF